MLAARPRPGVGEEEQRNLQKEVQVEAEQERRAFVMTQAALMSQVRAEVRAGEVRPALIWPRSLRLLKTALRLAVEGVF